MFKQLVNIKLLFDACTGVAQYVVEVTHSIIPQYLGIDSLHNGRAVHVLLNVGQLLV